MKKELLNKLNEQLKGFEEQKLSDEYNNIKNAIEDIEKLDITQLEEMADKFTCNGANAWLKLWTNGNIRRVYLNVAYNNGFRPNIKNNYIEF